MKKFWRLSLWLIISIGIVGAFYYAPRAEGFIGESSRILFFHVPAAWASFVAFMTAGVWAALYVFGRRTPERDAAATAAVEVGMVFGIVATITGALWARVMWGAYWNWDPRQTSITVALLFYAAFFALRSSLEEEEQRARLSASYLVLGLVLAPFLYFILPRITFSLHPDAVINVEGKPKMDSRMLHVLFLMSIGFTALFFWLQKIRQRLILWERKTELAS